MASSLLTPTQLRLDLRVEKEVEEDGMRMGVFSDGMPYLTGRGLAKLCGVDNKAIVQITSALSQNIIQGREAKIASLLEKHGIEVNQPYVIVDTEKERYNAFPAPACMAFLEYYAFEAGPNKRDRAVESFRALAQKGIVDYILERVGYDPAKQLDAAWQQFKDRISVTSGAVPHGYFIVFEEISWMFAALIRQGAKVGIHFVPDISVGKVWGAHWTENALHETYGDRIAVNHHYPEYFPQAQSNPQQISAYPEAALPEFRRWAREKYLPSKMPSYLNSKVKQGMLSLEEAHDVESALLGGTPATQQLPGGGGGDS